MALAADATANCVGDADNERAALLAVSQSHHRVRRLAGLRDEEADVISEDGSMSVQKVTGQLDHDGQLGELLQNLARLQIGSAMLENVLKVLKASDNQTHCNGTVVTCSATNHN